MESPTASTYSVCGYETTVGLASTLTSRVNEQFPRALQASIVTDAGERTEEKGDSKMISVAAFSARPNGNVPLQIEAATESPELDGTMEMEPPFPTRSSLMDRRRKIWVGEL